MTKKSKFLELNSRKKYQYEFKFFFQNFDKIRLPGTTFAFVV